MTRPDSDMFPWRAGGCDPTPAVADGRVAAVGAVASLLQRNEAEARLAAERVGKAGRMAAATSDEARILMAVMGKIMPAMEEMERAVLRAAPMAEIFANIAATAHVLALNAELQVDRAGEAGPALAVLADELRSLAKQSAGASRAIPDLVDSVSREMGLGTALIAAASDAAACMGRQFHALASQLDTVAESTARQAVAVREIELAIADLCRAV